MSDSGFWNDDWLETQQKYWQAWTDMGLKALGGTGASDGDGDGDAPFNPWASGIPNPWEGALDHWWQALAPAAPDMSKDFVDKLLDQGKMFFRMAEDLSHNYGQVPGDWGKALEKTFGDLQSAFSGGFKDGDETLHKVMAFWEMPFDNWQRMVSSLSLTPGDALRNMPHDQVQESLHRFLSAPGLGYTREEQGQYQSLMRRGVAYQKALHDYMQFFSGLGMKSVERLRQKMQQLRGDDKAVTSARGLYDLWVGTCEEVYGEQVMTPEYAAIHGRLVNALMGVKQRMMVIVDESLGALNMPTRTELRTLQDRLQENRRENKALRIELEQLKEAVEALGGAPAASEAPASAPETAAAPKAPVRRKATAKKAAARKTAAKPADR